MTEPKQWDFDTYDWIAQYDERMRARDRLCYEAALRALPVLTRAGADDLVLDVGTGTGNSAVPFLELGCRVLGVDPSEEMLKQAQSKVAAYDGRFTVQHLDDAFARLPLGDQRFDIIIAAYSIHHMDYGVMRGVVRGMKASLRPGGRIGVADTMFRDADHKREMLDTLPDLEDEYHPLLATFPAMFEDEGLEVTLHQVGPLVWVLAATAYAAGEMNRSRGAL